MDASHGALLGGTNSKQRKSQAILQQPAGRGLESYKVEQSRHAVEI
jgi:hypothetical protein